jgi:hypothetical protein
LARTALLSVSPFTREEERSQEVSPLRAFGHGLVFTARIYRGVRRMGKEVFVLSWQQKSFHDEALKSSPRGVILYWHNGSVPAHFDTTPWSLIFSH